MVDEILDNLYLGDIGGAKRNDIQADRVISVCQTNIEDSVDCSYEFFNLADGPKKYYRGEFNYKLFHDAAEAVLHALESGEVALVHCHAGQSRSPAVSIAAIAVYKDISQDESYEIVKNSRPMINPNDSFSAYIEMFIALENRDR